MNVAGSIKKETVNCEACSKPIHYFLGANAYSVICPSCGRIYDGSNGTLLNTNRKVTIPPKKLDIPIGTKGVLKKIPYQIIGYVKKKEKGANYFWNEYTLFNPFYGYAGLSVFNGHWIYFTEMNILPETLSTKAQMREDETTYDLYARYTAVVTEAVGEFPYNFTFEASRVDEYVYPPYMITSECTNTEYFWYKGEHISPQDIKEGFGIDTLPEQSGIGSIQPFFSKFSPNSLINIVILSILLIITIHLYFHYTANDEIVFHKEYIIDDSIVKKEIFTEPFDLKYGSKNLDIRISTNVDNSWMYSGVTLVNEYTGDVYDVDIEAEYYHGYTDGENWSEGNPWTSKVLSQIPEGRYHFVIFPDKQSTMSFARLEITATRDVSVPSNMIVVLFVILIFPIIYFYRRQNFENKRWSNSDYGE